MLCDFFSPFSSLPHAYGHPLREMSRRDTDLPKARQVPAIRPPVQGLRTSQGLERRAHGREGRVGERLKIAMVRPLPPSLPAGSQAGTLPTPGEGNMVEANAERKEVRLEAHLDFQKPLK